MTASPLRLPELWTYAEAVSRNQGLISATEQERLRRACVAVAGVGGVGGGHALTLARQGVGGFRLADPDTFSVANFNRQVGARVSSLGANKAAEVRRQLLDINPEARVQALEAALDASNIDAFLDGADVVVDGLDFFAIEARRLLFAEARRRGLWVLTAGPLGFSVASLAFDPRGMSFEAYCGFSPGMTREEQLVAFAVALAPSATHVRYMDYSRIRVGDGAAPSSGLACTLCNGVVAMEAVALLLGRRPPRAAPHYAQFDAYRGRWQTGRLWLGNRGPLQQLKQRFLLYRLEAMGVAGKKDARPPAAPPVPRRVVEAGFMRDILEAGAQAPSADNSQPWAFSRRDDEVRVFLTSQGESFADFGRFASLLGAGAVLENFRQAASTHGLELSVDDAPAEEGGELVAVARFLRTGVPQSPLAEQVFRRCTNRRRYERKSLLPGVVPRLRSELADFPAARLHVITEPARLARLAKVAYRAERVRAEHRPMHEELHAQLRWSGAEVDATHDGLPVEGLGISTIEKALLKLSRPWPVMAALNRLGAWRGVAAYALQGFRNASAAMLVTVPGLTARDLLLGGQAAQRLWLALTAEGLAAQPMMTLPLLRMRWSLEGGRSFPASHRELLQRSWLGYQDCFPDVDLSSCGQAVLLRVGYAPPAPGPAPRKPLEALLREPPV